MSEDTDVRVGLSELESSEKVQEAQRILQEKNQEVIQQCTEEINAILQKHGCLLEVAMLVTAQGSQPIVNIIPAPQQPKK